MFPYANKILHKYCGVLPPIRHKTGKGAGDLIVGALPADGGEEIRRS